MLEMCIDSIDSIEPFEANEHHVCARKDGRYMRSLLAWGRSEGAKKGNTITILPLRHTTTNIRPYFFEGGEAVGFQVLQRLRRVVPHLRVIVAPANTLKSILANAKSKSSNSRSISVKFRPSSHLVRLLIPYAHVGTCQLSVLRVVLNLLLLAWEHIRNRRIRDRSSEARSE